MNKPLPDESWLETWKHSYGYDCWEVFGDTTLPGYSYAYASRRRHTLELVQSVVQLGATILDVAAAQGNFSLTLAEMGYSVTWNDLREELIDYVRLKHERGEIKFAPGNVFDLDPSQKFDVVLVTEIIEHVAHPDEFLKKIGELVRPGGYVVLTTPNGGYFLNTLPKFSDCADPSQFEKDQFKPNSDGHIFLLHHNEMDNLAQSAGLKLLEKRLFTNSMTNGHLKTSMLLKVIPYSSVNVIERFTSSFPLGMSKKINTGMAVLLQRPA